MYNLAFDTKVAAISQLVEGAAVRSVERVTGAHRDTIIRLMVRVGKACAEMMDQRFRGLACRFVQVDELWGFCGKKQRNVTASDSASEVGDQWCFVAIDSESKLVPVHRVGKRTAENTQAFIADLASRVQGRIQVSSDKLTYYREAIERAFGGDCNYGTILKHYEAEPIGPGRYSPPRVVAVQREAVVGEPEPSRISTSHVESQNLGLRMAMRRFTRLTNAFSKKLDNLKAATALHYGYYNMVRIHRSLRATPAIAANVTGKPWTVADLVSLSEARS